jgi:excinuclease UvrABC helicase subunit UvrB
MKEEERLNVRRFVRATLGCRCPEEVFGIVECTHDIQLRDGTLVRTRLNIGNRLLVYVVEADDAEFVRHHVPSIASAGRAERDEEGFNRFRLVLASDDDEVAGAAEETYRRLEQTDGRMHLHVIARRKVI